MITAQSPDSADGPAGFKCLIADDSEFARKNLAAVIRSMGGSVIAEAKNGMEAVDLYMRHCPDLVLLDITMPRQDGMEALRQITRQDKDATVIMVSSTSHKELVWKAICLGAKSFVKKPFTPGCAAMMIRDVIDKKRGGVK